MPQISYVKLKHRFEDECERIHYYEYEIPKEKFYKNKDIENLIIETFANYYKIDIDVANGIVENFDLREDEGLLEELLENFMKELDEIFWDDDYLDRDNDYKKDGAC